MSILSSKTVLLVGEDTSQVHNLEEALKTHGVNIEHSDCTEVSTELIKKKAIDLVVLNHLHGNESCLEIYKNLHTADLRGSVPVFALIKDVDMEIQKVLSLGAADYITVDEDIASITQKMKSIFGQGLDYSGDSVIDITPSEITSKKPGIRVYVVEDDPLLRNLLSIRFDKAEFIYKVNSDGSNTVEEVLEFNPAVVILDLMLPGKDGFDVLTELRTNQQTKDLPVIVFSNRDAATDQKRAQELGAAGFYVKAMTDLSELIEKIESLAD